MIDADEEDRAGALADACAGGASPAGDEAPEGEAARVERAAAALERAWAVDPAEVDRVLDELRAEAAPQEAVLPAGYDDLGEIGRGGTGVVHRARQRALDRLVAVKVLKGGDFLFGGALARFSREARALAQLRHPHIVSIHEVGEERGRLWYAMDLVEGRSLAERLKEGPLAPRAAARLLADVADAVSYVHEHGLVHRDLKPANIVLDANGTPFVTDFGLALEIGGDDGLTLTGQIVGTPAYMSPEQARGDLAAVGPATDVYALGAVLYECLTGRRPFQGLSPAEQVYAAIHREPLAPRSLDPEIPVAIERICLQAMRKAPAERYATAAAMRDDLRRFVAGEPVAARPVGRVRRLREAVRRRGGVVGWTVAGVLAAALAGVFAFGLHRSSEDAARAFVEAGDGLLARGNGEGAARMFERAMAAGVGGLADRLTRARVLEARSLWGSGKAEEAAKLMERELVEGADRAHREWKEALKSDLRADSVWRAEGDVRWQLATALAVSGRTKEADTAFDAAIRNLHAWPPMERGPDGTERVRPPTLAARVAATLREATPAVARPAAVAQLKALLRDHFTGSVGAILPIAGDSPEVLSMALDLLGATADGAADRPRAYSLLLLGRRAVRRPSAGSALPVLANIADDKAHGAWARLAAAALLAEGEDLPVSVRLWISLDWSAVPDLDPSAVTTAWQSLRGMDPEKAHWARARLALRTWREIPERGGSSELRSPSGVPLTKWLAAWLESRTGMPPPSDADAAERWIAEHESEPAWRPLARALDLPEQASPPTPENLLRTWPSLTSQQRRWAHSTLLLLTPSAHPVPDPEEDADETWRAWTAIHRVPASSLRVAVALLRFEPARGWSLVPDAQGTIALASGARSTLRRETAAPPSGKVSGTLSLPGFGRGLQVLVAHIGFEIDLTPDRTAKGDVIRIHTLKNWGPGWSGFSSGGEVSTDFLYSPECRGLGYSSPDPGRNLLHVITVERNGASPAPPGTIEEWRSRIARDLGTLADGAAAARLRTADYEEMRFFVDYQNELLCLGQLASRLGVPQARQALKRLDTFLERTDPRGTQRDFCLFARVTAEDQELLEDPHLLARLAAPERDSTMAVLAARMWGRVLCVTRNEKLREVAAACLDRIDLPADVAGDLLEAERAGGPAIPASIRRKMDEGKVEDRSFFGQAAQAWPYAAVAALLLLGAVAAVLRWAWRGRPLWKRLVPAAWMVVLGLLIDGFDLFLRGVDVLPDAAGLGLAALGAWTLGRSVHPGPARWPAWLFAAAAVPTAVDAFAALAPLLRVSVAVLVTLGVVLLPTLVRQLRGPSEGSRPPQVHLPAKFVVLYALPMGWALFLDARAVLTGAGPYRMDQTLAGILLLAILMGLLGTLLSVRTAAGVRAAWLRLRSGPREPAPA